MTKSFSDNGLNHFSLKDHDARFHPNGFDPKKGTCKFRAMLAEFDKVDDLNSAGDAAKKYLADPNAYKSAAAGMSLEDLRGAIEYAEGLEELVATTTHPELKAALEAELDEMKRSIDDLRAKLIESVRGINSQIDKYGPNKPIPHDKSAFPAKNDQKWQDALDHYGDSSYGWHSAGSGSTRPHYIDFGGKRYFVKKSGYGRSTYTKDAAKNEVAANNFIRLAGFNAPDSKYYHGGYCVTAEADISNGELENHLTDNDVREEAASAYPLMTLMYNMDLMQNSDNAYVGSDGKPVFLDNGSTFGFSARGERNKYFDFDQRNDPDVRPSTNGGLTGLLDVGNNSSHVWNRILAKTDRDSILKLCARYNMGALVERAEKEGVLKHLPANGVQSLKEYAKKLDDLSDKYRAKQKHQSATVAKPTQTPSVASAAPAASTASPAPAPSPAPAQAAPAASTAQSVSSPAPAAQAGGTAFNPSNPYPPNPSLVPQWIQTGLMNPSWTATSGRAKRNAQAILTAATALSHANSYGLAMAISQIFKNGTFTPAGRGTGGVVTGANLPRKGIQALQRELNKYLNPNGIKIQVHNNGDITFSASNIGIAQQAIAAAGQTSTPSQTATATAAQPAPAANAAGTPATWSNYLGGRMSATLGKNQSLNNAYSTVNQWLAQSGV